MSTWMEKAKELRQEADYYEKLQIEEDQAKKEIHIGVYIWDLDANKVAKVIQMKQGCIDFGAEYVDGSYKRGYTFLGGRNYTWRLVTNEEILEALEKGDNKYE